MPLLIELRELITRHADPIQTATRLPGISLVCSTTTTRPVHHVYRPAFAIIAQGAKRAVLGDRVFDYANGEYLIATVDLPVASHIVSASVAQPYLAFCLDLNPAAIATLLLETGTAERALPETTGMGVSRATPDLLEPVVRLLRLFDRPRDVAILAPMLEREILWCLLAGEQGARVRQIGLADSRLSQISHALRWIRLHYAQTLRVQDLAGLAAMSLSSFHRHFRAVTAMSPLQYQKQIRLQEARSRLLAQDEDVAAVGFAVGYDSASQFSREYRRLFGAPPGRDCQRLRAGGGSHAA